MSDGRTQFLIAMYGEMWENINRHILVVWQSVVVLGGAFTAMFVTERTAVPLDVSASIVALVGCWQIAHVLDASWWFNRNQRIVTNIERQFLSTADLREVHCYFKEHRKGSMLEYLRIQFFFGASATVVVLTYHFFERVRPGFASPMGNLEPLRAMPYVVTAVCVILLLLFYRHEQKRFAELRDGSPGKDL